MSLSTQSTDFKKTIESLRKSYDTRRMASNLYPPVGQVFEEFLVDHHSASHPVFLFWFEDEGSGHRHVRLHDVPNTLSGDIIRLLQDLPKDPFHMEIEGDSIKTIESPPHLPDALTADDEDCSLGLDLLPLIEGVDDTKHFTKRPKYNSEILNHLKLQKGQFTRDGLESANHVITVLGKDLRNRIVFSKMNPSQRTLYRIHDLSVYKQWILELISALRFIHSNGIVHRDLKPANFLFEPIQSSQSDDQCRQRLVLCDLETRWGNRNAPELDKKDDSDAGWSEKSDIYDISFCIKGMVYGNHPINPVVAAEWEVPPALDKICRACTIADPAARPSLDDLEALVNTIDTT